MVLTRKKVGLALGGGAARGLAHVGVIGVLEREGVPIDCIAGTSAGSLVGAAYAAGVRGQRLVDMAMRARWRRIASPAWSRLGMVSFARLERYVVDMMGDRLIEDLDIPFAAVATDLGTGSPVVLRRGRVAPAVRASSSVPGIVTPLELNGRLLVDGAISNNLPISVCRSLGADVVIAVTLTSALGRRPASLIDVGVAAIDYWMIRAGDDPSSADVCITLPLFGLRSLLRMSGGAQSLALGRERAERALADIQHYLG